ncbi:hypothetical protein SESBI_12974 [Sesbania bispinosa]|nr:hypothetical protein SESBI_12974 [Sesbania bispinosa]
MTRRAPSEGRMAIFSVGDKNCTTIAGDFFSEEGSRRRDSNLAKEVFSSKRNRRNNDPCFVLLWILRVRLWNACELKFLTKVNNELTTVQRDRIKGTPFGWTVELPVDIQICGPLLLELALRLCERSGGIRISSVIVSFTPLDVCVALGLRIVG